jgi:hypothetical protein
VVGEEELRQQWQLGGALQSTEIAGRARPRQSRAVAVEAVDALAEGEAGLESGMVFHHMMNPRLNWMSRM